MPRLQFCQTLILDGVWRQVAPTSSQWRQFTMHLSQSLPSLQVLSLQHNLLQPAHLEVWQSAGKMRLRWHSLILAHNPSLGTEGLAILLRMIEGTTSLAETLELLDISATVQSETDPDCGEVIGRLLSACHRLRTFKCRSLPITTDGLQHLLTTQAQASIATGAQSENQAYTLQRWDLMSCAMTDKEWVVLLDVLKLLPSLEVLNIAGNLFSLHIATRLLGDIAQSSPNLLMIYCESNAWGVEASNYLACAWQEYCQRRQEAKEAEAEQFELLSIGGALY